MIIHSDVLTWADFSRAANLAHVDIVNIEQRGSRSRKRAFNWYLSGSSPYAPGFGRGNGEKAASWDEWGIFFAHLFDVDPNAHCRKHSYQDAEHFHWVTGDRFKTLRHDCQHNRHKWGYGQRNVTGTYSVAQCDCGAIQRWLLNGTWEDMLDKV